MYKIIKKMVLFNSLWTFLWAGFLSIATVIGSKVDRYTGNLAMWGNMDTLKVIIYTILLGSIACMITHWLNIKKRCEVNLEKFSAKSWIMKSLIILVAWLPYFLMFYPGNMSVDSFSSIQQIFGQAPLSNAHPIMYTAIVGLFVRIGTAIEDLEFGIALYSLFQMTFLSALFGGIVEWFKVKGAQRYVRILSTAFFAFNPVIAMYSMTMWKDILFSAWLLLLTVYLYEILVKKESKNCDVKTGIILSVLGGAVAFSRNNGIYIIILVYVCLLIYWRKSWRKIAPFFGGVVVLVCIIQGPVYNWMGVEKGNIAESLAVPLQQIAYVAKNDGVITAEQEKVLNRIIPLERMAEVYTPYSSNSVKFDGKFDNQYLEENTDEFLKVWVQMLPANLKGYVKAYLTHTLGYWHIGTNDWRCVYGGVDSPGIKHTNILKEITGMDITGNIQNVIEFDINTIPIINLVYSIAFSVWAVIFSAICFIIFKESKLLLCLLPLAGNWITIMIATPVFCEFRYMFAFHIALPLVFFMIYFLKLGKEKCVFSCANMSKDEEMFGENENND